MSFRIKPSQDSMKQKRATMKVALHLPEAPSYLGETYIENLMLLREEAKERFSLGTHNVGFIFRTMGFRYHNFLCCVGWVPLLFQKALGSPFSPKSHSV